MGPEVNPDLVNFVLMVVGGYLAFAIGVGFLGLVIVLAVVLSILRGGK